MAESTSVFLTIPAEQYLLQGTHFFVIEDGFPVSPGHCLIVSRLRKVDYFDLNEKERRELTDLIRQVRDMIEQTYAPAGYNIGMNCGRVAGQTVMHFHCHVIPRYPGDMDKPDGGVRHCVVGRGHLRSETR